MTYDIDELKEKLKQRLLPKHFEHCLGTAETAVKMARAYVVDEEKALVAGLLHDYTKSTSRDELLKLADRFEIGINSAERYEPMLLHAKIAARLVKEELEIDDSDILNAIENHTVGAPEMAKLDKIIYVADMIEPGRLYPGLDALRAIALSNLDMVFKEAYIRTVGHLVQTRQVIHPMTVEVWNKLVVG